MCSLVWTNHDESGLILSGRETEHIVLQCQTHVFVKRRVVADSQNGLFDPTYGRNCCVYVDFFIECLPQKLEIHLSQQAFPEKTVDIKPLNHKSD